MNETLLRLLQDEINLKRQIEYLKTFDLSDVRGYRNQLTQTQVKIISKLREELANRT